MRKECLDWAMRAYLCTKYRDQVQKENSIYTVSLSAPGSTSELRFFFKKRGGGRAERKSLGGSVG